MEIGGRVTPHQRSTKSRKVAKRSMYAWCVLLSDVQRQRATIALEATPLLAAEAKKRQQQHGGTAPGKGKNTSVKNDKSDSIDARKQVAKQFDVSQGYVHAVKKIREADEHIYQQVKSGLHVAVPCGHAYDGVLDRGKRVVSPPGIAPGCGGLTMC